MLNRQANTSLGAFGENLAAEFLTNHGFEILVRNFRCGKNEIDLIAKKGTVISFVEVKTRKGKEFGHPAEAVTRTKQTELAKAAECYLRKFPNSADLYRFDVIAITIINNQAHEILFIEDAFRIM
jgi:putative endonuclease